jgi:hypothetical protein
MNAAGMDVRKVSGQLPMNAAGNVRKVSVQLQWPIPEVRGPGRRRRWWRIKGGFEQQENETRGGGTRRVRRWRRRARRRV